MADEFVSIEGLRELEQAMEELSRATAKNVARRVLKKSLEPMRETAEKKAPDDPRTTSEDLHRSIAISDKLDKRLRTTASSQFYVDMYMGPMPVAYPQAMIQEFGAPHHPPQAYMRPAWEQHKGGLLDLIADQMQVEISKAVQRARRKALKNAR